MPSTQIITSIVGQNVQPASGNTPDIDVQEFINLAVEIRLATLTGGTTPGITFSVQRKDANGNYVILFSFTAVTAVGVVAGQKDIGPGLEINKIPGKVIRISWVTTGAPTTATADISVQGDSDI